MHKQIESLIELAYREWKTEESKKSKKPHLHPELLASLLEKPLPDKEHRNARLHIVICEKCSDSLAAQFNTEIEVTQEIPPDLINWAKALPIYRGDIRVLVKVLRLKKKIFMKLASQRIIAALLRHPQLKNFLIGYR
jgi:hypothetical protein